MDVIQLIKFSPKCQAFFENIKTQQDSQTSSIHSLCPTRWTVRTGAMQAIVANYEVLHETMEKSSHGTDDCSRRAGGVLALMERFSTYFGLKLSILIFGITEQLSVALQGVNTTVNDSYHAVDVCIKALEKNRADEAFHSFFEKVKSEAANKCDPPVLPRQRQIPKRINDGASSHNFMAVEDLYRKEYFQAIDCVKGELVRHFHQDNFLLVRNIEAILLKSANGNPGSFPNTFQDTFSDDIDMQKLSLQLQILPDAIISNAKDLQEVTQVQSICDVLNEQPGIKKLLTEVHKLIRIYYTISVTMASAERSFSALKRIKTYLRNSMTQQRLNHCMLLHVHVTLTDHLDLRDIAKEFVRRNERRRTFIWTFLRSMDYLCTIMIMKTFWPPQSHWHSYSTVTATPSAKSKATHKLTKKTLQFKVQPLQRSSGWVFPSFTNNIHSIRHMPGWWHPREREAAKRAYTIQRNTRKCRGKCTDHVPFPIHSPSTIYELSHALIYDCHS